MPFTCTTCHQALTTERNFINHVRRFHPNINEEQVMCKICNTPFSAKSELKRHNIKFHGDETPALNTTLTESSEEENIMEDRDDTIEQKDQKECSEPGLTCIRRDHGKIHTQEESSKSDYPTNATKTEKIPTEEMLQNFNPEGYGFPIDNQIIMQDEDSRKIQSIISNYTVDMLGLALTQQRNADFIKQNTSHISKILQITKDLIIGCETSKIYQAQELRTKTYHCQICNKIFKNSRSLSTHKCRYHREI